MLANEVYPFAEQIRKSLQTACVECVIAGSLRRGKPEVKDIEIVAVSKAPEVTDLFGDICLENETPLEGAIKVLVLDRVLRWDEEVKRNGPRYKRLIVCALEIPVEIFIADADNFGNQLAIRTGSADFTQWFVTRKSFNGGMPNQMLQKDGYLYRMETAVQAELARNAKKPPCLKYRISCPTEEAFFAALGLPCMPPGMRNQAGAPGLEAGNG